MNSATPLDPNIVLITTHDLGRHVHCYGASTVHTPSLDGLARDGVRFAQAFATSPQCSPARASLATGRYPHSAGVMGLSHGEFAWHLPPSERHLASLLRSKGYHTSLFGLQHVTNQAGTLGFDTLWERHASADDVAAEAVAWLKHQSRPSPFYLEIGLHDTHRPWTTNPPFASLGAERPRWLPPYPGSDEEMAALQGQILAVDRAVGTIRESLQDLGSADRTWVIFTSDHGLAMPRAKGTLYDPGLEVPLIMRWPDGGLNDGRVIQGLVSHVDLVPTILDALHIPVPGNVQGVSLWPLCMNVGKSPRAAIFGEKTYHTTYDPIRCVRDQRYKLIMHFNTYDIGDVPIDAKDSPSYEALRHELTAPHPYVELFDLATDPLEQGNIADQPQYSAVLSRLLQNLKTWMRETQDPLLEGPVASPQYRKALRILDGTVSALQTVQKGDW